MVIPWENNYLYQILPMEVKIVIIYKITNNINNKVYIGLTTCSLSYRWTKHLTECKNINNQKHLYRAMRKYGPENFSIEQIDSSEKLDQLGQLERYYIKKYNSQNPNYGYNLTAGGEANQWDANPAAKLTYDEVVQIREKYAMGELKLSECWQLYKNKISYSAFQKVWNGTTWPGILDWVYTKENIELHRRQKANPGSKNGNSLATEQEILNARHYYVNHTLEETYKVYGSKYSKSSFRHALTDSYSHIPIYSKVKKQWILNNEIVDINNYNPVSTISISGE